MLMFSFELSFSGVFGFLRPEHETLTREHFRLGSGPEGRHWFEAKEGRSESTWTGEANRQGLALGIFCKGFPDLFIETGLVVAGNLSFLSSEVIASPISFTN